MRLTISWQYLLLMLLNMLYSYSSASLCSVSSIRRGIGRCMFSTALHAKTSKRLKDEEKELYFITSPVEILEIVKKSKFYARAAPAKTFAEATKFIDSVKDVKASHNCWAYRSKATTRCSDDGEPSGTAGKPILNILESENILDTVIVVTRYFGGTKLGAGGLIRAYGGAAKLAVSQAEKQLYISTTQVSIQVPLDDVGSLYQVIQQFQGNDQFQKLREDFVDSSRYTEAGEQLVESAVEGAAESKDVAGKVNEHSSDGIIDSGEENIDSVIIDLIIRTEDVSAFSNRVNEACKGKEVLKVYE